MTFPAPGHTDGCHTDGCLTYGLDDARMAFTGDALPERCQLYPAHDYAGRSVTSVAEERLYNSRLGGDANEHDVVIAMANLHLAHPHRIAEAPPANLRSG